MIDAPSAAAESAETAEPEAARYSIDPSWFAENNLSFESIVRSRVCSACRDKFGQDVEERVPIFDKATGKPHFEVHKTKYGDDPIKVIRDHCSRAKGYITRDMPTLEAVFRVLLASGNEPLTLDQVREQLAEWCPGGGCQWLLVPQETIERLIRSDSYYGLRQAVEAA